MKSAILPFALSATTAFANSSEAIVTRVEKVCATTEGECTFFAAWQETTLAQWQHNLGLLQGPLSDSALETAMKACLFDVFAYTHYSPEEQTRLARATIAELKDLARNRTTRFSFYRFNHSAKIQTSRTLIVRDSCNVGGPSCSLVIKEKGENGFLKMASDVCD